MAASDVVICNLALAHVGSTKGIASLTERSEEARSCQRFYEQTRDEVLQAFPWPFAAAVSPLALVAEDPTDEWAYSYRLPADCLAPRRIQNGLSRVDTPATRVPYAVIRDASGLLVLTDKESAVLEYTMRATDPAFYPPDFVQCLALKLAVWIAPAVTKGDPGKLGVRAFQLYQLQLAEAWASAANVGQADPAPESDFITCRN